jgi:hypothetical protein
MWDAIYPYLAAILPTIGLLVIAYVVFKTIFEADRRERKAVAEWEARHDGQPGGSTDESRSKS